MAIDILLLYDSNSMHSELFYRIEFKRSPTQLQLSKLDLVQGPYLTIINLHRYQR